MRSNHEPLLVDDWVIQHPLRGGRHRRSSIGTEGPGQRGKRVHERAFPRTRGRLVQSQPHLLGQHIARTAVRLAGVVVQRASTDRPVHVPLRPRDLVDIDATITASKHDLLGLVLQLPAGNSRCTSYPDPGSAPPAAEPSPLLMPIPRIQELDPASAA